MRTGSPSAAHSTFTTQEGFFLSRCHVLMAQFVAVAALEQATPLQTPGKTSNQCPYTQPRVSHTNTGSRGTLIFPFSLPQRRGKWLTRRAGANLGAVLLCEDTGRSHAP